MRRSSTGSATPRWLLGGSRLQTAGARVPAIRFRLSAPSAQAVIASLVRVARAVMRQLEAHFAVFVEADSDALVFTAPRAGRRARSLFQSPGSAAQPRGRAGLPQITFRGLRQSFVAILVVARCNVREVSERT